MTKSGKNIGEKNEVLAGSRLQSNRNVIGGGGHKYLLYNRIARILVFLKNCQELEINICSLVDRQNTVLHFSFYVSVYHYTLISSYCVSLHSWQKGIEAFSLAHFCSTKTLLTQNQKSKALLTYMRYFT